MILMSDIVHHALNLNVRRIGQFKEGIIKELKLMAAAVEEYDKPYLAIKIYADFVDDENGAYIDFEWLPEQKEEVELMIKYLAQLQIELVYNALINIKKEDDVDE